MFLPFSPENILVSGDLEKWSCLNPKIGVSTNTIYLIRIDVLLWFVSRENSNEYVFADKNIS